MKKKFLIVLAVVISFVITSQTVQAEDTGLKADELNVKMKVSEEGLVDVYAEYKMDFVTPHRGIFINVPAWYEDFKLDDVTLDILFPIREMEALSDQAVSIEHTSAGSQIRFGEESLFLEGKQTYAFRYQYEIRPWISKYRDMDAFFASVIEKNLGFPVDKVSVDVEFPKKIDDEPLFNKSEEDIVYDFDGQKLHFETTRPLQYENISFSLTLPHDYFSYINHDYQMVSFAFSIAGVLLTIFIYLRVGKAYPLVKTVEFTAPDDFSSAEVAYVYKGYLNASDVTSLIIMWASQGYLKIEELGKENMLLTKRKELETPNIEEKRVFDALFSKKDEVETKSLKNHFHGRVSYAQENIPSRFEGEKSIFEKRSRIFQGFFVILIVLMHLASVYTASYRVYPEAIQTMPYMIGAFVALSIQVIAAGTYGNKSFPRYSLFKYVSIFVGGFLLEWLVVPETTVIFYLSYLLYGIALYYWANFYRRSRYGMDKYGQILGLADFIKKVEKPRLEKLLDENPSYFYDVMPYAQVLGLSKAWANKFKNLEVGKPDWYVGRSSLNSYTGYYMWQSMNRSMHAIEKSLLSVPAPAVKTGQSGSSSGGGFSGGSGGGFGGMSGGGW